MLDGMGIDQLTRLLSVSKWTLGALAVLIACVGIFNEWLSDRIDRLKSAEEVQAQHKLAATAAELAGTKAETTRLAAELARVTTPRSLGASQIEELKKSLSNGPKGKVIITFLSVEIDAENYAKQIAAVLTDTRFEVVLSKALWLQLAYDGLYLCAHKTEGAPPHAVFIQKSFQDAGIRIKGAKDLEFCSKLGATDVDVALVASNRE